MSPIIRIKFTSSVSLITGLLQCNPTLVAKPSSLLWRRTPLWCTLCTTVQAGQLLGSCMAFCLIKSTCSRPQYCFFMQIPQDVKPPLFRAVLAPFYDLPRLRALKQNESSVIEYICVSTEHWAPGFKGHLSGESQSKIVLIALLDRKFCLEQYALSTSNLPKS